MLLYERNSISQNSQESGEKAEISLVGNNLKISILTFDDETSSYKLLGEETLDLTANKYTSWYFATVAKYNKVSGKFFKVHPFTATSKTPLNEFDEILVGRHLTVYFQIDLGLVGECDDKVALKTLRIPSNKIDVTGFNDFNIISHEEKIVTPREVLWDNYAVQIGNQLAGCDNKGLIIIGDAIEVSDCSDYLEFTIKKYSPGFQNPLTRDIDNETVFIEATAGMINTSRVELINGAGKFRFYPLGYKGKFKLKFGWKYYSGWSEYEITIKE